jgi:hypothetical protein
MEETMGSSDVIIDIKPILGENVNDKGMLTTIRKALQREAQKVIKEFDKGTDTWKRKPNWKIEIQTRHNDWVAKVSTGDKPFVYVERGTKTRRRLMSKDWVSKTRPKVLSSGPGQGVPTGFAKKNQKMPGIKARDFRVIISEQQQPKYEKNISVAIAIGANSFFAGAPLPTGNFSFTNIK